MSKTSIPPTDPGFRMFTLKDVGALAKVSNRTLLRYIQDGRLKAVKIGGAWRVSEENLKKFVNGETEE